MRIICLAVLLFACLVSANAAAQSGDLKAGREVALRICASCHVVSADQDVPPMPGYAPSFFDLAARPENTRPRLRQFLSRRQPMHKMPHLGLSRQQIDDVSAYLLSLR